MKVLITLPCLGLPGGVANYYSTLRKHLDQDKHYFEIGSREGETSTLRVAKRLFQDWRRFWKELRSTTVDLVHINPSLGIKSLIRDGVLLLIAKGNRKKVVIFFRGWDPGCEALVRRRFLWLFKSVYGQADAFIVLGTEFHSKLQEFGIRKPTFLETTLIDDEIKWREPTTQPADVSRDATILFLSRLDHGKGLLEGMQAFRDLQRSRPGIRMTIAGDGPIKPAAEQYTKKERLTGVEFTGHVSGQEKARVFQNADIYLFTSFHEGMPNSVLEAMAYGLPIVTSFVGGLRDFFEPDRMGKIIDPRDPGAICRALNELLEDPATRAEIGKYNRDYAQQHFSASTVAKRLVGIYEQIIEQSA
jgi:glycosyltransferase involved in cell wall biosynthesis